MNRKKQDEAWSTIIKADDKLFRLNIRELAESKELIEVLVRRDFVTVYKQTILGPLWFIIQPLITTVMYTFVFGNIAKISTSGIPQPLFYFSGTMVWTFFSNIMLKCSDTFIANAQLFGKIYFPRLAVPISYVATNLITLGIQFAVFFVILIVYIAQGFTFNFSPFMALIPILIIQAAMFAVGVGLTISSLTTKYRDLRNLVNFGMTLWMYVTPVVYPMDQVPARFVGLYRINPMAQIIEAFRYCLLGGGSFSWSEWGISLIVCLVIFFFGIIIFNRNARNFVDVI